MELQKKIFREYDIRGVYPTDLDEDVAYKIGLGYGSYLQEFLGQKACVVSHDNRLSSDSLHTNLIRGLLETGIKVIDYGLTTTPMHYYARHVENLFGVMITASHNPKDDNGFKFSFDEYANARGSMVMDLKNYIDKGKFIKGNGVLVSKNIMDDYINYVVSHIDLGNRQLKVVLDPANGVPTLIARKIYEHFNIDLTIINEESDGSFPNHHPDPSIEANLEQLKKKVVELGADVGFGYDGDGDRIGIVDEKGNMVSIEDFSIMVLHDIFDKVSNKRFLYDAKSSNTFKDEVEKMGGEAVICRTATSYTQEKVLRENLPYGFQYVGHISFNDRLFSTESAMYSSLRMVELLSKSDKSLSEIVKTLPHYHTTAEEKYPCSDDRKFDVIKEIQKYCDSKQYKYIEIDGLKILFPDGWAYVRASNTGPNITTRFEAKTEDRVNVIREEFISELKKYL